MTTYRAAYLAYPQSTGVVLTAQDERSLSDDELLTIARNEMEKVGIPAEDAQYLTIGDWMDGEIDEDTAITEDRVYAYTVRSEGDAPETVEATDPRAAAAQYARGQDWRDCDEEVSRYSIFVADADGRSVTFEACTGEDGFGALVENR